MDDRLNRSAPQHVMDELDASLRDLAAGAVGDAGDAQAEARRLLANYDRDHPKPKGFADRNGPKRSRTA